MTLGMENTIQTVKDSKKNIYTEDQKEIIKKNRKRSIIGDPDFVSEQLKKLQQDYLADEIMILTVTGSYESRIRSYELIARNLHN